MMKNSRYKAEQEVLEAKLPSNIYRFMDMNTSKPYLVMAGRTNSGNIYTLRIELDAFPESVPKVFVTKMLYDKFGLPLDTGNAAMHVLRSENGCTQICHYSSSSWTNRVSLYKVYIKCRLWLEMYEAHLRTGEPIDYYLKHQS